MIHDTPPQKKIPRAVTPAYLERAALDYLGKYSSSSENLRRVLLRKVDRRCRLRGEEAEPFHAAVEEVVAKALRIGLIDDRVYTEAKVASLRRRGNSGRMIQAKLAAKGLDRDDIRAALDGDENHELDAARKLVRRRRIGPYRTTLRPENRNRDIAVLARAGFSFSLAASVIDEDIAPDGAFPGMGF